MTKQFHTKEERDYNEARTQLAKVAECLTAADDFDDIDALIAAGKRALAVIEATVTGESVPSLHESIEEVGR